MTNEREEIGPLLSAYGDGELSPVEQRRIEALLAADPELAQRLDDQLALSSALVKSLDAEVDEIDFSGFADEVMAKLPPPTVSLASRIRTFFENAFEFRKLQVALGAATVAAVAVVTVPYLRGDVGEGDRIAALVMNGQGQEADRTASAAPPALDPSASVLSVETAGDYETMLFKTSAGTTIIYVREVQ